MKNKLLVGVLSLSIAAISLADNNDSKDNNLTVAPASTVCAKVGKNADGTDKMQIVTVTKWKSKNALDKKHGVSTIWGYKKWDKLKLKLCSKDNKCGEISANNYKNPNKSNYNIVVVKAHAACGVGSGQDSVSSLPSRMK